MSEEVVSEIILSKTDLKNSGVLEIRAEQGTTGRLEVFFRHPVLAKVIAKMAMGNYPAADFASVYKPCLMEYPDPKAKGRAVSRPSIYAATKNLEAATDFDFARPPRGVLVANPEALDKGFSLLIDIKAPVPPDSVRKWGELLIKGCADIIAAARPYKMQWIMSESPMTKQ